MSKSAVVDVDQVEKCSGQHQPFEKSSLVDVKGRRQPFEKSSLVEVDHFSFLGRLQAALFITPEDYMVGLNS